MTAWMWRCGCVKVKPESGQRVSEGLCLPAVRNLDAVCTVSLGESLTLLQEAHGSGASVIIRDFPQSFTVASPPTDLQQGLGLEIRVKDALLVLDLGKKGMSIFSAQGGNRSHQPGPHSDFLPAAGFSDWSHKEARRHGYPEASLAGMQAPGSGRNHVFLQTGRGGKGPSGWARSTS